MRRLALIGVVAGILPVVTVNVAYLINFPHGVEPCFNYLEGCMSVSRAVRSGPGLVLFKIMALPSALCMAWFWARLPVGLNSRMLARVGVIGAAFFLVYAAALGSEGEFYRWMRRYGVVLYFGLTGLAQLIVASRLWRIRRQAPWAPARKSIRLYAGLVGLTWALGVASAFKRRLSDDPEFIDRLQNALEWDFALALSLLFVALAYVIYQYGEHRQEP